MKLCLHSPVSLSLSLSLYTFLSVQWKASTCAYNSLFLYEPWLLSTRCLLISAEPAGAEADKWNAGLLQYRKGCLQARKVHLQVLSRCKLDQVNIQRSSCKNVMRTTATMPLAVAGVIRGVSVFRSMSPSAKAFCVVHLRIF